jgi:hypothetical protein
MSSLRQPPFKTTQMMLLRLTGLRIYDRVVVLQTARFSKGDQTIWEEFASKTQHVGPTSRNLLSIVSGAPIEICLRVLMSANLNYA